ncbi:MAG: type II secretion system protein [Lachnospiraceae bacterium]|nr:type II secretion system protein [Lachnospiraceae bacterium]
MKKMNKKGFTMAELLIVVAIIAVLVAIAIPIFTTQLEKSREATDAANIRAAYAEVVAAKVSGETDANKLKKDVELKQTQSGWQTTTLEFPANLTSETGSAAPTGSSQTVTVKATDDGATINLTFPTATP